MAFVNKRKKIGIEKDVVGKNHIEKEVTKSNPHKFEIKEQTWEEHAEEILNELEKSGVDIYDETRTPGMYLNTSSNKVKSLMSKFSKPKTNEEDQQTSNKQSTVASLLDFFNQK